MKKSIGIDVITVLMASSALAASPMRHQSGVRVKQTCRCYTNQSSCSGQAIFSGAPQSCAIYGYPKSCSVYHANGGKSNIYLYDSGDVLILSVGYGDMVACVAGTGDVPP